MLIDHSKLLHGIGQCLLAALAAILLASAAMAGAHQGPEGGAAPVEAQPAGTGEAQTGTDPRDFAPKFMPYYLYTELENGLVQNEVVAFGLYAFEPKFAMTYEIPVAVDRNVKDTSLRQITGECTGVLPGGGSMTLPNGLPGEGDCQETALGDMNLRFMYRTDWSFLNADWLVGAQLDLPTATKDEIGTETFSVGPMIAPIWDLDFWPGPGAFAALMNFYFRDVWKDSERGDVDMYVGRWFFMLPLRAPGPGLFDGIYLLPEIQPIYDFENSDFSLWAAPEFGKVLAPGKILYFKPGFGVNPDSNSGERETTFEIGFRLFLD